MYTTADLSSGLFGPSVAAGLLATAAALIIVISLAFVPLVPVRRVESPDGPDNDLYKGWAILRLGARRHGVDDSRSALVFGRQAAPCWSPGRSGISMRAAWRSTICSFARRRGRKFPARAAPLSRHAKQCCAPADRKPLWTHQNVVSMINTYGPTRARTLDLEPGGP
jgi:hypothetical protein